MSARFKMSFEHAAELVISIKGFSEGLRESLREPLFTVGMKMLEDMRSFTPVQTGYLLSTENIEEIGSSAFVIYARAFYAPFVEWGTRRMAARLFMTRAFELHRDEVQEEIYNAIASFAARTLG